MNDFPNEQLLKWTISQMNNFLIAKFPKWTISQIYNVPPSVIFPNRQYPNVAFKNGIL